MVGVTHGHRLGSATIRWGQVRLPIHLSRNYASSCAAFEVLPGLVYCVSHEERKTNLAVFSTSKRSLLAPSGSEETKLNSPAHSTVSKSIISELKRVNDDLAFRNFNDQKRDGQTKTSTFFVPPGGVRNPSLAYHSVRGDGGEGYDSCTSKTFYFRI